MNTTLLYLLSHSALLAQATKPVGGEPPWWAGGNGNTMLIVGVGVIAMIFMFTSSSKAKRTQEKQRTNMLDNLKRGDRVETIGGILASVVESRENEVVLKIDESTNTKIRMSRAAIKRVTSEDAAAQAK